MSRYQQTTCSKVHQDAGLVCWLCALWLVNTEHYRPLIGQYWALQASDWSPPAAKYIVKDAGGLSPPAGSRWLLSIMGWWPLPLASSRGGGYCTIQHGSRSLSSPKWFNPKHSPGCVRELPGGAWHTLLVLAPKYSQFFPSLFSQPGPSWCQCTQGASYLAANQRRVLLPLTNERPASAGYYFPSLFTHWRSDNTRGWCNCQKYRELTGNWW